MLTRILYIPFAAGALIFLYLAWEVNSHYYWHLLGSTMALILIYLLGPQINWWWYQRYPPDLPAVITQILENRLPFYQRLSQEKKMKFRNRAAMYMEANEFIAKGMKEVAPDLKAAVACSVVQLTFGKDDYLLNKFEHIVIYAHPFPSPQYPDNWHSSEIFPEDGVVLFSAEQLMPAFLNPTGYFHIGLYEYARIYRICHPEVIFPSFYPDSWKEFEVVSGFKKDLVLNWIGLPEIDLTAVATVLFFVFPEKFKKVFPEKYDRLAEIFNTGMTRGDTF